MRKWMPAVSSLLLLGMLVLGTWWVVQTKRPPGAMTPLEAQGMDMSVMKPPRGAFPVGVEEVQPRPFLPSVAYPATFRAYNEEIIRARITGKLVETRVYPGDRVRPVNCLRGSSQRSIKHWLKVRRATCRQLWRRCKKPNR